MNTNKKGFAIAAFVLGILSIILCCVGGFIPGIIGFILGIISLRRRENARGMAIAGMVMAHKEEIRNFSTQ